jgi:hypothetical protein
MIIHQRPLPETRTAENSCAWLASAAVDNVIHTARSRRGAPHELARALVAAGVPDQQVSVTHEDLRGEMSYPSLHRMADRTYVEGRSTTLHGARYREDERFAASGEGVAEAIGLPETPAPPTSTNALQLPAGPTGHPAGERRQCASCGQPFIPKRVWAQFCSPKCRVSAHRRASKNALQPATEPAGDPLKLAKPAAPGSSLSPDAAQDADAGQFGETRGADLAGGPRGALRETAE